MTMNKTNEEMLEVWDWETGKPTGEKVERRRSHREGIPHEGVHLWVIRTGGPVTEILFQQRAVDKDLYPDCLDITVGGHVPFGENENKIEKEAYEEIGIIPDRNRLVDLGYFRYEERDDHHFHREFQRVYLLEDNRQLDRYRFVDGEVTGIYAVPLDKLEGLFTGEIRFPVDGYDGEKTLTREVGREDFHPLLFATSMKVYVEVLLRGIKEYSLTGRVSRCMPGVAG
jgi:isopentenyldiphosphate isomerase